MIKAVIVEDKKSEADVLKEYLARFGEETGEQVTVEWFCSADKFLYKYNGGYDVCFMDIEMPGINGMDAARKLRKIDGSVALIFVTNLAQFAICGYEVDALDYFLKPVKYYDLKLRMERVRKMCAASESMRMVSVDGGTNYIGLRDVTYIESDNHVLKYHTFSGVYTSRDISMKQAENNYRQYGFARCNVCYLVNLRYCTAVRENTAVVGGEELAVSRAKRKEFLKALSNSFRL